MVCWSVFWITRERQNTILISPFVLHSSPVYKQALAGQSKVFVFKNLPDQRLRVSEVSLVICTWIKKWFKTADTSRLHERFFVRMLSHALEFFPSPHVFSLNCLPELRNPVQHSLFLSLAREGRNL